LSTTLQGRAVSDGIEKGGPGTPSGAKVGVGDENGGGISKGECQVDLEGHGEKGATGENNLKTRAPLKWRKANVS